VSTTRNDRRAWSNDICFRLKEMQLPMNNYNELVDVDKRTVSPRIFFDPDIYRAEQHGIFGRSWLYLAHECQLPEPGSFVTTFMGEEPIIVWRGADGTVRAFINSCRHRGMKICRLDEGSAPRMVCPYHAWTYNSKGELVGRPEQKKYGSKFDPSAWGLIPVARISSYAGFIFGCFDKDVCDFDDYLGDIKWYLDTQLKRTPQGRMVFPGVQKWTINTNWKFPQEQLSGDNYHAPLAHSSVGRLGFLGKPGQFAKAAPYEQDFEVRTSQGHGWINLSPMVPPHVSELYEPYEARVREQAAQFLSPKQADLTTCGAVGTIFPNFAFVSFLGSFGIRVLQPKGPTQTEIWFWAVADSEAPDWRKKMSRDLNIRAFTTAGIFEMDDAELWAGCQEPIGGFYREKFPLNYELGAGGGRRETERPGLIDSAPTELGVFGFYERWKELITP
jgi:3-phenylpropionate/trans-cinnamate dioxygenase subunit alpha